MSIFTYLRPEIYDMASPSRKHQRIVTELASRRMDYMIKLFKYKSAGVHEYWIVDPAKKRVTVYDFAHDETEIYTFSDTIRVGI